jgi:hypothetical protein
MTMRALVSDDRPVVRIWHPDNPKVYVEIQFESQAAANTVATNFPESGSGLAGLGTS